MYPLEIRLQYYNHRWVVITRVNGGLSKREVFRNRIKALTRIDEITKEVVVETMCDAIREEFDDLEAITKEVVVDEG